MQDEDEVKEVLSVELTKLLEDGLASSIILFGSSVRRNTYKSILVAGNYLQHRLILYRDALTHEGDLDILIIGRKNLYLLDALKKIFSKYGKVIFHPDFYSYRPLDTLIFEIIVLPPSSRWLATRGRLVGLSIFQDGNYVVFDPDYPPERFIYMPEEPKDEDERREIALKSYAGLVDMYMKLWAAIGNSLRVDPLRVAKWLICDSLWIRTGTFYLDNEILISLFKEEFPNIAKRHEALINLMAQGRKWDYEQKGDYLLRITYKLAEDLIKKFRR